VGGKLATAARVLLGLIFVVFGVNGFLSFIPAPPLPERAVPFVTGLLSAGYFFPLLKSTEIVAGLLLLSGRFVPVALVALAPIVVNIVAFHIFLAPDPVMPLLTLVPELYLAWAWRSAFASLFTTASPLRGSESLAPSALGELAS
jgi:putative oxidoreductase